MGLRAASRLSFNGLAYVLDDDPRLLASGGDYFYTQSGPATVWTIQHDLGFDPAGVVVVDTDGFQRDGFGIQYMSVGQSLRLSFDIALAGTAYLS